MCPPKPPVSFDRPPEPARWRRRGKTGRWLQCTLALALGLALPLAIGAATAAQDDAETSVAAPAPKPKKAELKAERAQIDSFFETQDVIPYLTFRFSAVEWGYLLKSNRRYAECTMTEGGNPSAWQGVAVKLKGSLGSFQKPDAKPGLSISMNKYKHAERWRGFLKWHLNNGAQDDSFLNEQLSCEIARAAGVPASRCGHALVNWQTRDLGLYVFKEAFDKDFLTHFFKHPDGDLYEVGGASDITEDMEKSIGDPEQRDNVKELIGACQESDEKKRWDRLGNILDVEEYLSFTAVEALTCHWDGYNFNRNNYRLYFDADTGKAIFFVHGTDQTFGDANFPIVREPECMVGTAVMSNPEWKAEYRERLRTIYERVLKPIDWPGRAVAVGEKVKAALARTDAQAASEYANRINEARDRVANRIQSVGRQLEAMHPMKFDEHGLAKIPGELWRQEGGDAEVDGAEVDGKECLHIRAKGKEPGSWRQSANLDPGKYRLRAQLKTAKVVASKSTSGIGAGLRISGSSRTHQNGVSGNSGWKDVDFDFDWPGGDLVIVAELRATKGDAWFERDSVEVVRRP